MSGNVRLLSGASLSGGRTFSRRPAGLLAPFDLEADIFAPVQFTDFSDATIAGNKFDTEVAWTATHTDQVSTESGILWYNGDKDGTTGDGWGLTFMGVVCMWLFWACVYMHQMYPIIAPQIEAHH